MNLHRLFIAIRPPQSFIDELLNYQQIALKAPIFRWVPPLNLHLTLIFLGAIRENQLVIIKNTCDSISQQVSPFLLEFSEFCYGPNSQNPRLVWLKGTPNKKLSDLVTSLSDSLRSSGIVLKEEFREFQPHITVARLKSNMIEDATELPPIQQNTKLQFTATSLSLIESVLKISGAEYHLIDNYNFRDSGK
ncbi:MAG: RNA 2',3'-cyclic phosphodiesterase [Candidatus Pacebacteria bacterium]|nr:RNA 2',3'-cyclic phosphodiesterase [Candidatus Paceibacterota bacterium]